MPIRMQVYSPNVMRYLNENQTVSRDFIVRHAAAVRFAAGIAPEPVGRVRMRTWNAPERKRDAVFAGSALGAYLQQRERVTRSGTDSGSRSVPVVYLAEFREIEQQRERYIARDCI